MIVTTEELKVVLSLLVGLGVVEVDKPVDSRLPDSDSEHGELEASVRE